jgi:hypothetical protein
MPDRLTSQECAHAKRWLEAGFLSSLLVLEAQFYVQRIREDNSLLLFDTEPVVEISHHLHKASRIARVLTHPPKRLCVRLGRIRGSAVLNRCVKRRLCFAQARHRWYGRCRGGRKSRSTPFCGYRERWDLSLEGLQERRGAECISKGNAKNLKYV